MCVCVCFRVSVCVFVCVYVSDSVFTKKILVFIHLVRYLMKGYTKPQSSLLGKTVYTQYGSYPNTVCYLISPLCDVHLVQQVIRLCDRPQLPGRKAHTDMTLGSANLQKVITLDFNSFYNVLDSKISLDPNTHTLWHAL